MCYVKSQSKTDSVFLLAHSLPKVSSRVTGLFQGSELYSKSLLLQHPIKIQHTQWHHRCNHWAMILPYFISALNNYYRNFKLHSCLLNLEQFSLCLEQMWVEQFTPLMAMPIEGATTAATQRTQTWGLTIQL